MQTELKKLLTGRLDKYFSRETVMGIIGLLGLLETQAGPELWAIFTAVVITIFRGAKAFETWAEYKHKAPEAKTEKVESIVDTQDTPSDKPDFG